MRLITYRPSIEAAARLGVIEDAPGSYVKVRSDAAKPAA